MSHLDDLFDEAEISAADREALSDLLHSLSVPPAAPAASPELAAFLGSGEVGAPDDTVVPEVVRRFSRPAIRVAAAALVAVLMALTGLAAASNNLPGPVQKRVSQFSERYLPFRFPAPEPPADQAPPDAEKPDPDGDATRTPGRPSGSADPSGSATASPTSPRSGFVSPSATPSPTRASSSASPSATPTPAAGRPRASGVSTPTPRVQE